MATCFTEQWRGSMEMRPRKQLSLFTTKELLLLLTKSISPSGTGSPTAIAYASNAAYYASDATSNAYDFSYAASRAAYLATPKGVLFEAIAQALITPQVVKFERLKKVIKYDQTF